MDDRHGSVSNYLSLKGTPPKQDWLESFLRSASPSLRLDSLQQLAYNQILTTDITTSVQAISTLPTDISDPSTVEQRLPGPILVQLLDVEDIGTSSWSQVEAIEAQERGETTRGREVIRVLPEEHTSDASASNRTATQGPHKLCLQDVRGTKVYAIELKSISGITTSTPIGSKLILQNFQVARGVILLEPSTVRSLGGVVGVWDTQWRASRKARLTAKIRST